MIQMTYKYRLNMHMDESSSGDGLKMWLSGWESQKIGICNPLMAAGLPKIQSLSTILRFLSFSANKDLHRLFFFMRGAHKEAQPRSVHVVMHDPFLQSVVLTLRALLLILEFVEA